MIANATQLLVTLACGLPKPFCYSLTRRSFSLWLFLLSLLLTLLSSPTIPAGTLPPHSIKSVSPPHTDTTLLSSSSPPLSPLYPIMPWGWNRKKNFLFYIQVLTSPPLSFVVSLLWALLKRTHGHTHVPGEEGDSRSLSAAVWSSRPVSSYCWQRGTLWRAVLAHRKAGWDVELSEEANEERGRDGGEPFEGERGQRA